MGKVFFWVIVITLAILATQNNWFAPITGFFNNIKGDIEYQRNYVPTDNDTINDGGMLTIEREKKRTVRQNALGTVHSGR